LDALFRENAIEMTDRNGALYDLIAGAAPSPAASMEVQGLPEPDWLAVDTPGADFDVSFALTMQEALQLNEGDPDAPTYVTKLYSEEKVRALAVKNGWRLGEWL
jgi:hypothetical protein